MSDSLEILYEDIGRDQLMSAWTTLVCQYCEAKIPLRDLAELRQRIEKVGWMKDGRPYLGAWPICSRCLSLAINALEDRSIKQMEEAP